MLGPRHGDDSHASPTAAASATGMDMDSHGSGGMVMMSIFQTEMRTPLYSDAWTPNSAGAYAATCVFLIALAALLRGVLALKALQEARWLDRELKRRYVVVNGKEGLGDQLGRDALAKQMVLSENGVEENVTVVQRRRGGASRPWRLSVDPLRACLDVVIAGVGYLLMLAVMTMNVGYFLSILAGVFIGSLLVGRYAIHLEH